MKLISFVTTTNYRTAHTTQTYQSL